MTYQKILRIMTAGVDLKTWRFLSLLFTKLLNEFGAVSNANFLSDFMVILKENFY